MLLARGVFSAREMVSIQGRALVPQAHNVKLELDFDQSIFRVGCFSLTIGSLSANTSLGLAIWALVSNTFLTFVPTQSGYLVLMRA